MLVKLFNDKIESLYIILYLGVVYWNLFFILEDKFFYWFIDNVCKLVGSDYKKIELVGDWENILYCYIIINI